MKQILKTTLLSFLLVVIYKLLAQFIVEYTGYWIYTLILLITPVILFIAIARWKEKPSFMKILLFCTSTAVTAGICIGITDFIVLYYRLPLFGPVTDQSDMAFLPLLLNYAGWYLAIGLLSGLIIWSIFFVRNRFTKVKN